MGVLAPFAKWKNANLRVKPGYGKTKNCDQSFYKTIPDLLKERSQQPEQVVHSNCCHNEYVAWHMRYLKETPELGRLDPILLNKIIESLSSKMAENLSKPCLFTDFIGDKKGPLRSRYIRAANKLARDGYDSSCSVIKAFIKNERYFEEKPPRLILGRDPRFNILYGRYVVPLEQAYMKLKHVTNGDNFYSLGEKFSQIACESTYYVDNDMSKYESSQRLFAMRLEFDTCVRAMRKAGYDESSIQEYTTLFAIKMEKRVISANGVEVDFNYCRGSGDMDTSLGNGLLNCIATAYFSSVNFCPMKEKCHYNGMCCKLNNYLIKGDDSVIGAVGAIKPLIDTYRLFGFDSKLVIRKAVEEVEYCSGHFIEYQPGKYIYAQDLRKLLRSLTTVINNEIIDLGYLAHYYASLGFMYGVLYKNLPIFNQLATLLMSAGNFRVNTELCSLSYNLVESFRNSNGVYELHVDRDLALVSMSMCMGIAVEELCALERRLASVRLDLPITQFRTRRTRSKRVDTNLLAPVIDAVEPVLLTGVETKNYKDIRRIAGL